MRKLVNDYSRAARPENRRNDDHPFLLVEREEASMRCCRDCRRVFVLPCLEKFARTAIRFTYRRQHERINGRDTPDLIQWRRSLVSLEMPVHFAHKLIVCGIANGIQRGKTGTIQTLQGFDNPIFSVDR